MSDHRLLTAGWLMFGTPQGAILGPVVFTLLDVNLCYVKLTGSEHLHTHLHKGNRHPSLS